jgi:hypothetical protein
MISVALRDTWVKQEDIPWQSLDKVTWPHLDFDRVWGLVLGGRLKYSHLYFTKPHCGHGLVVSASFSNELEE